MPNWQTALRLRGRQDYQLVRVTNSDLLTPASHDPDLFPRAQHTAHSMQRRARHFGQVLTRNREIYLNPSTHFTAGLIDEPQQRAGDPLFYLLCRHFNDAVIHLAHALTDRFVGLGRKAIVAGSKIIPKPHRP